LYFRTPQQGVISIPAASFVPTNSSALILNHGDSLRNLDIVGHYAVAGLQLPDRATITSFSFYWYDNDPINDITITLDAPSENTQLTSSGDGGQGSTSTSSEILLNNYAPGGYFLKLLFRPSVPQFICEFRYAVIEYEYPL
jgi:hypothetical protein